MKRPGDTKPRPPGGGAAGRAHQFEVERGAENETSKDDDKKDPTEDSEKSPSKKKGKKGTRPAKSK
jgi:hypothetical protein